MHNKWEMCNKPGNGTQRSKVYWNETNMKGEDCEAIRNSTLGRRELTKQV